MSRSGWNRTSRSGRPTGRGSGSRPNGSPTRPARALAVALAVNPVPLLDFLAGPGGLAILVRRVSEVYGEKLSGEVARALACELIRGGRVVLWGSLAATVGGGAMKLLPGLGHLAGALTQGASAGYFGHVVGRALVDYLDHGHDWGDGGLVAALDRIAAFDRPQGGDPRAGRPDQGPAQGGAMSPTPLGSGRARAGGPAGVPLGPAWSGRCG